MIKITREEFFKKFPPDTRNITISFEDGTPPTVIPVGDDIACDRCNGDVDDEFYLTEHEVLCCRCAERKY